MKVKFKANLKGFSLMELMIAMAILSVILIATIQIFSNSFAVGNNANVVQRDIENLQFALDRMSKSIRMSAVESTKDEVLFDVKESGSRIDFYSNSEGKCISYKFDSDKQLKMAEGIDLGESDDLDACGFGGYTNITPPGVEKLAGTFTAVNDNLILILVQAELATPGHTFAPGDVKLETAVSVKNLELDLSD